MEEKGWRQVAGAERGSLGLILNAEGSGDYRQQSLWVLCGGIVRGPVAVRPVGGAELESRWK